MSGTAISALPAGGAPTTNALLPIVTLGSPNVTQRITIAQVLNLLNGNSINGPLSLGTPGTTGTELVNFSQFNPTAAGNGTITFPGNVRLQWGSSTTVLSAGFTQIMVTFPVAFAAAPWAIIGFPTTASNSLFIPVVLACQVITASTANFYSFNSTGGAGAPEAAAFFWVAAGQAT